MRVSFVEIQAVDAGRLEDAADTLDAAMAIGQPV